VQAARCMGGFFFYRGLLSLVIEALHSLLDHAACTGLPRVRCSEAQPLAVYRWGFEAKLNSVWWLPGALCISDSHDRSSAKLLMEYGERLPRGRRA